MVTIRKSTESTEGDSLALFFAITFAITWGIGALAIFLPGIFRDVFGEISENHPFYYLAVAAPTISATCVTFIRQGWGGLKALYSRLISWRFDLRLYALVLLGLPALGWLAAQLAGPSPLKTFSTPAQWMVLMINLLVTGPLGEELGWRGYALPRLLKRYSPLVASLILGAIWGIWHLPAFFVSATVQNGFALPLFLYNALCLSILATWLFQKSAGSVLIVVLLHYVVNICASILGVPLSAMAVLLTIIALIVIWQDRTLKWFQKSTLLVPVQ